MMRYFCILLFFLFQMAFAQSNTNELIDQLSLADAPEKKIVLCEQIATKLASEDWKRATTYLELAEKEAQKTPKPEAYLPSIYFTTAELYSSKDLLDISLSYYQKAYNIHQKNQNQEELYKVENNFAIIYARMKNPTKALHFFKKVYHYLHLKNTDSLHLAQISNNIGTLYMEVNPDSSMHYFRKSLLMVPKNNNRDLKGYIYTNMGRLYDLKKDIQTAQKYFNQAISISKTNVEPATKKFIYQSTAQHFLTKKQNDSAIQYAQMALKLHQDDHYSFTQLENLSILCKAYLNNNDFKNAAYSFESYTQTRDSLNIEEKAVSIERLKLEQEFKTKSEIQKLNDEKQLFKYSLIGVCLMLGILFLLYLLFNLKTKIKNNKAERLLLKNKQKTLRQNLETKSNMLVGKTLKEIHRNEIIQETLQSLKQIKLKVERNEVKQNIDGVIKKLQSDFNTDIWNEFEINFAQVHQSFYTNLESKHPDLTPKDRRLCALLSLDLSTKEISQIIGQSFKSVENARTRIRKKLDITNEKVNISTYLKKFS